MADHPLIKVTDPADPERCQFSDDDGQCGYKVVADMEYCSKHGGARQKDAQEKNKLKNYLLTEYNREANFHAQSPEIKNLRDEIAILRMVLQKRLNDTNSNLILDAGPISSLILNIKDLVLSCHKLEGSLGETLDKSLLIQFADEFTKLIAETLNDQPKNIAVISEGTYKILNRLMADD